MKIENNTDLTLKDIKVGEVFAFHNGFYMKIDSGFNQVDHYDFTVDSLVIDLTNNTLHIFENIFRVKKVNAKLILE